MKTNTEPTKSMVTTSKVMVNGIETEIPSTHHVVKSAYNGREVVEPKDIPFCCSVASETYWSS